MKAFDILCSDDFCEYDEENKYLFTTDFENDLEIKVCDVEIFENKRGVYLKLVNGEEKLLIDETDIESIKNDGLRLTLLNLIEEAEELSRGFYLDADDYYENLRLND
jgi:hypothetical protein